MMRETPFHIKTHYRLVFCVVALLTVGICVYFWKEYHGHDYVLIGTSVFCVDIADTDEERQLGLSGRRDLCASCGMLFVFDEPGRYQFWMKDMFFDLDVVWISDGRVVDVKEKISHDHGKNEIFETRESFDQLLELPAGTIEREHITIGQSVSMVK